MKCEVCGKEFTTEQGLRTHIGMKHAEIASALLGNRKKRYYWRHREKVLQKNKEYYQKNKEWLSKKKYGKFKEKRDKVIKQLGNCCYVCGSTNALVLHHKFGDGFHKNLGRHSWEKTIFEAYRNPERFVLLCKHCHIALEQLKLSEKVNFNRLSEILSCLRNSLL